MTWAIWYSIPRTILRINNNFAGNNHNITNGTEQVLTESTKVSKTRSKVEESKIEN